MDLTYRSDLCELNELDFARFDAKLEQRLAELRAELLTELRQEIAALRVGLGTEIAGLRGEFRAELHQVRAELLRWMFGFWVSTLLGIAGLLIALRDLGTRSARRGFSSWIWRCCSGRSSLTPVV